MSIGNLKDNGNKGNNFPYQLAVLKLLGQISAASGGGGGGGATEATALAILAAVQNGQEFEQNLVIDTGGVGCPSNCPTYLQIRIFNTETHTFDPPIYYNASGAVVVPVGPLQLVNPQYVLDNILTQVTAINADLDVALSTRASEATLALLNAKFNSLGQKLALASVPVVLASDQTLPLPTGAATETTLAALNAKFNSLGQKLMAASVPVVLASDQSPIPTTINDSVTGIPANVNLQGQLQVSLDALPVFNETFEGGVIDIVNRWNAPVLAGTGTATQGSTLGLVLTVGTTANNGAALSSIPTFPTSYAAPYSYGAGLKIEAGPIATGNHRFFGFGTPGTAYSTTNPIRDGIGFEITPTGILRAVVYASDVLIFSSNLATPTDGLEHIIFFTTRGNFISWYFSSLTVPDVTSSALNIFPDITLLPIRNHSLNSAAVVGIPATTLYGITVLDGSRSSMQLADGIYPWRKAAIDTLGNLSTSSPDLLITGQATQTAVVANILTTTAGAAAIDANGYKAASIQVVSTGTGGTFIFEGSNDNVNFQAIPVYNQIILTGTPIVAAITATASQIIYSFPVRTRYIRLRIATTITGGSIQAFSRITQESWSPAVYQVAQATAANLNATVAGTVTANLGTGGVAATSLGKAEDAVAASGDTGVFFLGVRRDALTTSATATGDYNETAVNRFGAHYFAGFRTSARTYSATVNVTVAASATDIFSIFGNATTTVYVNKIRISGIQTTGSAVDMILLRRSAASTGGTTVAASVSQHDTVDAVNSSTPVGYSANPTPGASAGNIRRWYQSIPIATAVSNDEYILDFEENGKPIILAGTAQGLSVNLNGVTVTGGIFNINIEWSEF